MNTPLTDEIDRLKEVNKQLVDALEAARHYVFAATYGLEPILSKHAEDDLWKIDTALIKTWGG